MRSIRVIATVYTPARSLEWHCGLSALAFGLVLALPGHTFDTAAFWGRFASVMPEWAWAAMMLTVGFVRIASLIVNGNWPRGTPLLRAVTALLGAGIWAWIAGKLFVPSDAGIQTGAGLYLVLAISDVRNAFRAGKDIVVSKKVWGLMDAAPPAPMPRGFAP